MKILVFIEGGAKQIKKGSLELLSFAQSSGEEVVAVAPQDVTPEEPSSASALPTEEPEEVVSPGSSSVRPPDSEEPPHEPAAPPQYDTLANHLPLHESLPQSASEHAASPVPTQ